MSKTLKINGATVVPVSNIRRIRPVTDDDRARITERYDQIEDAAKFQLQIEFADKSTKLTAESLDDLRGQGVALVNIGNETYVPAVNIKLAEPFTKEDAEKVKGKDYTLSHTFRSRVETSAGTLLSTATADQVITRREKAIESNAKPEGKQDGKKAAGPKAPAA
jgi:hypothetical protein